MIRFSNEFRVLVGCERSGKVRAAFRRLGVTAYSCDVVPSDDDSPYHVQGDLLDVIGWDDWDMLIAFPPCTHLAASGARWFKEKRADGRQQNAIDFFMTIVNADIPLIAVENPVGIMSTQYRKPDQIIQPWQFGHGETKSTCLWLKGLPLLQPTNIVEGRSPRMWKMGQTKRRAQLRSETYQGIADAMASQWVGVR